MNDTPVDYVSVDSVSYCFNVLGADSMWGECAVDNEASAAVMRRAGLEFVGTINGQHQFRVERARQT